MPEGIDLAFAGQSLGQFVGRVIEHARIPGLLEVVSRPSNQTQRNPIFKIFVFLLDPSGPEFYPGSLSHGHKILEIQISEQHFRAIFFAVGGKVVGSFVNKVIGSFESVLENRLLRLIFDHTHLS